MKKLMYIYFAFFFVTACKQQGDDVDAFRGKYIDKIEKYTIIAEDGSRYEMNEKKVDKIYYLIRHAEKDTVKSPDPVLSFNGELRSTKLAEILWNTKLDAVYSTMTTRCLFTVDSIADTRHLSIIVYEPKGMKEVIAKIRNDSKQNKILIVGHSNTTPVLANYIYGTDYFKKIFDETDYDNFIVVMENKDKTKTILPLKYKFY